MSLQSFVWYIFGAINTWSGLPFFEQSPEQLIQNSNLIVFERLSFYYHSNYANSVASFESQYNLGQLNACANVGSTATNFEWKFESEHGQEIETVKTTKCLIQWKAPNQGTYLVTLIVYQNAQILMQVRRSIRFIDFWIVSIGDSFSSGEGNPDIPKNETRFGRAEWLSEKCHRSKRSWPHKIYEKVLNFTRDKFSVHFTHLSCSGASIDGGTLPIMSQLDIVEAIQTSTGVKPDLVMITAGGNDVGFSSIINQLMQKRSLSASRINFRLLFVAHQFDRLAKRIQDAVKPSQVIFPTYFQFANNERGHLDTECADLIQMTKSGIRFAQSNILQRLNQLIQLKSNNYGWTSVPEVTQLFNRSGLCAKNSLIRTTSDSIKLQGDSGGSLHPTEHAHSLIADLIFSSKLNFRDFIPN